MQNKCGNVIALGLTYTLAYCTGAELTSPFVPTNVVWKLRMMSKKKTTSTTLSMTSIGTSSIVLCFSDTLYGTNIAV